MLTTYNVPGMAYGLMRGGELIYANGFGVRNLETGAPMTPQPGVDVITVLLPQEGLGIIAMGNAYGSLVGAETPYYLVDFVVNTLGKLLHGEI